MPYLLLALGLGIGLFSLYRFFLRASTKQIKGFFLAVFTVVIVIALFYMAVTGRLPAALALVLALLPFAREFWKLKNDDGEMPAAKSSEGPMTRHEALDILGLEGEPDKQTITKAYKELMKKVHPDTKGSQGLARKLNEAKDVLLKQ